MKKKYRRKRRANCSTRRRMSGFKGTNYRQPHYSRFCFSSGLFKSLSFLSVSGGTARIVVPVPSPVHVSSSQATPIKKPTYANGSSTTPRVVSAANHTRHATYPSSGDETIVFPIAQVHGEGDVPSKMVTPAKPSVRCSFCLC